MWLWRLRSQGCGLKAWEPGEWVTAGPAPAPAPRQGRWILQLKTRQTEYPPLLTDWSPSSLEKAICLISLPIQMLIPPYTLRNIIYPNSWAFYAPAKLTHQINCHRPYMYSPGNNENVFLKKLFFQKYVFIVHYWGDFRGLHFMFLKTPWTLLAWHIFIFMCIWSLCWWPSQSP